MALILDIGIGNVGRLSTALSKLSLPFMAISQPSPTYKDDFLIIPGVGAFGDLVSLLSSTGLDSFILDWHMNGNKILAICAGFQILFETSQESSIPGLSMLPGHFSSFSSLNCPKSLNVGFAASTLYNSTVATRKSINDNISANNFYFSHSFCLPTSSICELPYTSYYTSTKSNVSFVSALFSGNIYGLQFHPELSHRHGLSLLKSILSCE
jgi:imidazole glycerol phosphate synthase glutamine amidotransferase subunit